jgi:hypothetical protein
MGIEGGSRAPVVGALLRAGAAGAGAALPSVDCCAAIMGYAQSADNIITAVIAIQLRVLEVRSYNLPIIAGPLPHRRCPTILISCEAYGLHPVLLYSMLDNARKQHNPKWESLQKTDRIELNFGTTISTGNCLPKLEQPNIWRWIQIRRI